VDAVIGRKHESIERLTVDQMVGSAQVLTDVNGVVLTAMSIAWKIPA
jgi:hypothetical protein